MLSSEDAATINHDDRSILIDRVIDLYEQLGQPKYREAFADVGVDWLRDRIAELESEPVDQEIIEPRSFDEPRAGNGEGAPSVLYPAHAGGEPYVMIPVSVLFNPALLASDIRVYGALLSHARNSGKCWPKESTLAREAGIGTDRHVRRILTKLAAPEIKLIRVERQPGRQSVYHIVPIKLLAPKPTKAKGKPRT